MHQAPYYRSVRAALAADVGRVITMTACGVAAFAPIEYALTFKFYAGPVPWQTAIRLVALTATLSLWLWLWLAVAASAGVVVARLVASALARRWARGTGWFVAAPLVAGVRPGVSWLWAIAVTGAIVAVIMQRVGVWAFVHYKEPQLTAALIAALGLPVTAAAAPLGRALHRRIAWLASRVAPRLGVANPLGRWRAVSVVATAALAGVLAVIYRFAPNTRSEIPHRHITAAVVIALGMGLGAKLHASRRPRRPRRRDRRIAAAIALAAWAFLTMTLWKWGGDLEAKYMAKTASPTMDALITSIRIANDLDRDGYGSLLGENDCAPFDASINPDAKDIPDDGIDQNCDGHDFTLKTIVAPPGEHLPVPPQFQREWNVLFITIDATRYDSTTFGGSMNLPKHRDTTPRLAELVKKSTSFTFCNAPSAGTMASIPAILSSKFFHDGLALGPERPGMPPKVLPENTILPEIMKRGGYHTGVIGSHEYWNDWGLDQGVDDYDNSIGKTPDPFRVAADKVTDHILAYISRQHGKWFMWAHYIDPHGRYVAHPDVVDWDGTEPDRYDAELRWTDQQVGRLLDEMRRMGVASNTIVIITSDHGDSMGEHNVPLGTHGTALYRELQHVPMIFYIPENTPHLIGGAVTNLDIVPTIAAICGIDVHDLTFEGISLVPAIFYGKEDHDRIVFAETNAPNKQRAAISERWKLIHYFASNVDELFDLKADPWEHVNLASKHPPELIVMKNALDAWLERVMFSRDPKFNQALAQLHDVLLTGKPTPELAVTGQTLDVGHLEVVGVSLADNAKLAPDTKTDIHVFYTAHQRSEIPYRLGLIAWPIDALDAPLTETPIPSIAIRLPPQLTGAGAFASDRWRPGEYVRDRFTFKVPSTWRGAGVAFGLVAVDPSGKKASATGAHGAGEPEVMILGALPMVAPPALPVAPLPAGAGSGSSAPRKP